ncbi:MAG: hypothetical protein DMF64_03200 [Acidobacteria bacterium]|nr:MAG: hypothetical protein DMF64_03200 [Acidobacteriota bacterium]
MSEAASEQIDRLSLRARPAGAPIMKQNWGKLLFMHWRIAEEALRPLIPQGLTIDTYDGSAWLAIAPFTMWDVRLSFTPPVPGFSDFHELNVRTYVHHKGVPGVWFFSLDANSLPAVIGARTLYHLPYFHAQIELEQQATQINYRLRRDDADKPAELQATWMIGARLPESQPGSLEFFLTERYCLYAARSATLYRARIHHAPWPLQRASLTTLHSTMIESHGLPTPAGEPLLHYAEALAVDIWPIEKV